MERKGAQDQAQRYRRDDVFDGVFHGVALLVASVDGVSWKGWRD